MTEADWLSCKDPMPMLTFLRRKATARKLRLFACACCRRNLWFPALKGAKGVVEASERWAEGEGTARVVERALDSLDLAAAGHARDYGAMQLGFCSEDAFVAATYTLAWACGDEPIAERECAERLRDVVGNPFRPVAADPSWLTSTVLALARGIYADRAFDRLPILADALQDAGCDHVGILDHCRGPGPHARGCWVVDLVLGLS